MTPKQEAFVREYLIDLNATQAAIRAGYSERTAAVQGFDLLRNPKVAGAVAAAQAARAARTELTADRILLELRRLALFDPRKLFDDAGEPIPIHQLDDDTAAAVAGLEVATERNRGASSEDEASVTVVRKYKVADKNSAIDKAMRHLGILKDKVDLDSRVVLRVEQVTSKAEQDAAWQKPSSPS